VNSRIWMNVTEKQVKYSSHEGGVKYRETLPFCC
jgi:hypothetical protein